ncbi:MAG: hypothetical protein ACLTYN_12090 [Dysosmobacter welbionis]
MENFLYYPSAAARLRYLGNTLVKTAPLLMCSLSVLFAYKVGLFNIGAAGGTSSAPAPACTAPWASGCPGTCACWRLLLPVRCWAPSPGS